MLAFGDPAGGVWGAALDASSSALAFGDRHGATAGAAITDGGWCCEDRGWHLQGEGFDLQVAPAGEDQASPARDDEARPDADGLGASGYQELCGVRGTLTLAGSPRRVDCIGTRCVIEGVDAASLRSARAVSGWFAADDAFLLLALRAGVQRGQDADLVAATLFDPEGWVPVVDPRLSTTYGDDGMPRRTSLELWVGEGENEFPRRAAGEAQGAAAELHAAGLGLRVVPLRCHSRGHEGAGVYLLAGL